MILAPSSAANHAYARSERREDARRVLNVWASWRWARILGADCPTLAAVFDRAETDSHVWVNSHTGEMRAQLECPGHHWLVAQAWVSPRNHEIRFGLQPGPKWRRVEDEANVATSTRRMLSPVHLVGLAVDEVFCFHDFKRWAQELLLESYPYSGLYERPPATWERPSRRGQERGQGGRMDRVSSRSFGEVERTAIGLIMSGALAVRRVA